MATSNPLWSWLKKPVTEFENIWPSTVKALDRQDYWTFAKGAFRITGACLGLAAVLVFLPTVLACASFGRWFFGKLLQIFDPATEAVAAAASSVNGLEIGPPSIVAAPSIAATPSPHPNDLPSVGSGTAVASSLHNPPAGQTNVARFSVFAPQAQQGGTYGSDSSARQSLASGVTPSFVALPQK
jgi:hypothetical protein